MLLTHSYLLSILFRSKFEHKHLLKRLVHATQCEHLVEVSVFDLQEHVLALLLQQLLRVRLLHLQGDLVLTHQLREVLLVLLGDQGVQLVLQTHELFTVFV